MTAAYILYRGFSRMRSKYSDLYHSTGSRALAAYYVAKYIMRKMPYLLRNMTEARKARSARKAIQDILQARTSGKPALAVRITGGLGDYIVIARFLRDLAEAVEPFELDIYCNNPTSGAWVFAGVPGLHAIYHEFAFEACAAGYDVSFYISQFIVAFSETIKWARIRGCRRLTQVLSQIIRYREKINKFVLHHPFTDGYLGQFAFYSGWTRRDFLHGISGIEYGGDGLELELDPLAHERFGLRSKQYVTVHNGFDPAFIVTGNSATKCYPYFSEVVEAIKRDYPDLKFVQVGTSTSTPIAAVDLNLVNKTSTLQLADVIANARFHIDNEGGLVHLARTFGVRSCVIFGPTSADYFSYPDNVNVRPSFCGGCWWVNDSWMDRCPRGFAVARCMSEQSPERVADAIRRNLLDQLVPSES